MHAKRGQYGETQNVNENLQEKRICLRLAEIRQQVAREAGGRRFEAEFQAGGMRSSRQAENHLQNPETSPVPTAGERKTGDPEKRQKGGELNGERRAHRKRTQPWHGRQVQV